MFVLPLLASVLAAAPAEGPVQTELPPCIDELVAYNQRGWYPEILDAAGACVTAAGHPRVHYYSGIAHLGLQQRARAILAFRQYLADGPDEPQRLREIADARATQAMQGASFLVLEFTPPVESESVFVDVRPDGAEPFKVDIARLETQADGTHLWLDPGRHVLKFTRGNVSREHEVVIVVGESSRLRVDMAPKPTPAPVPVQPRVVRPTFPVRAWFTATGSLAGANLIAGVALTVTGYTKFRDARAVTNEACEPTSALRHCRAALVQPTQLGGLGVGFLGAGIGVLVGSLTGLAPNDSARRRAWRGELGAGSILAVAGSVVLGVHVRRFNDTNGAADASSPAWSDPAYQADITTNASGYIAGAALIGAGVGLVASTSAGLLVQRYSRNPRSTRWQVHPQGVAVRF